MDFLSNFHLIVKNSDKKNSPHRSYADFCEITPKINMKMFAKFHFVMNLFQVNMTIDHTMKHFAKVLSHKRFVFSNTVFSNL